MMTTTVTQQHPQVPTQRPERKRKRPKWLDESADEDFADEYFANEDVAGEDVALEPGEDVVSGMRREIEEEAAIVPTSMRLAGTISWPGFGKEGEDWFGFIFRIDRYDGEAKTRNEEGELKWVPIEGILDLPLWEGDRHFLPLVFADPLQRFSGVMPYRDGSVVSWHYEHMP